MLSTPIILKSVACSCKYKYILAVPNAICVAANYRVFHLRTTILPAEEDMPAIMSSFKKFNDEFMEQYEDNRGYSRM